MDFKRGDKVWAHTEDGGRVGFVHNPEPNDDGKHGIQVGDKLHPLAYRETGAGDDAGGTFQQI